MLVSVVSIGNSKGIRIPENIMSELNIKDKLELQIRKDEIILKPVAQKPRQGWDDAFKEMHKNSDDGLLISDSIENDFNWEW
jgi:antitoxin MazE